VAATNIRAKVDYRRIGDATPVEELWAIYNLYRPLRQALRDEPSYQRLSAARRAVKQHTPHVVEPQLPESKGVSHQTPENNGLGLFPESKSVSHQTPESNGLGLFPESKGVSHQTPESNGLGLFQGVGES
jgi:hypothetical protein